MTLVLLNMTPQQGFTATTCPVTSHNEQDKIERWVGEVNESHDF